MTGGLAAGMLDLVALLLEPLLKNPRPPPKPPLLPDLEEDPPPTKILSKVHQLSALLPPPLLLGISDTF
jgi:hypothetical protein